MVGSGSAETMGTERRAEGGVEKNVCLSESQGRPFLS